jgi:hypothetical protein
MLGDTTNCPLATTRTDPLGIEKEVGMTMDVKIISLTEHQRRDVMKAPDEVSAMLRLKALG